MTNDVSMMLLAVLASQGGIAVLLAVMARLEPGDPEVPPARQVAPRPAPAPGRLP